MHVCSMLRCQFQHRVADFLHSSVRLPRWVRPCAAAAAHVPAALPDPRDVTRGSGSGGAACADASALIPMANARGFQRIS